MRPNQRWSIDFVSDRVNTGKVIRMLTMVDDCTRECPAIEVDTSLGGLRVRRVLDRVAAERGLPEAIVLDNGPEFRGRALAAWSEERGVRLEFIQPGKPVQNAYVESFNGRLRDECLNANWFTSLSDARTKNRNLAARLQPASPAQFAGLLAARRICTNSSGDEGMRKASTVLLEQGTQAPSPAPDLIPAENERRIRARLLRLSCLSGALREQREPAPEYAATGVNFLQAAKSRRSSASYNSSIRSFRSSYSRNSASERASQLSFASISICFWMRLTSSPRSSFRSRDGKTRPFGRSGVLIDGRSLQRVGTKTGN